MPITSHSLPGAAWLTLQGVQHSTGVLRLPLTWWKVLSSVAPSPASYEVCRAPCTAHRKDLVLSRVMGPAPGPPCVLEHWSRGPGGLVLPATVATHIAHGAEQMRPGFSRHGPRATVSTLPGWNASSPGRPSSGQGSVSVTPASTSILLATMPSYSCPHPQRPDCWAVPICCPVSLDITEWVPEETWGGAPRPHSLSPSGPCWAGGSSCSLTLGTGGLCGCALSSRPVGLRVPTMV